VAKKSIATRTPRHEEGKHMNKEYEPLTENENRIGKLIVEAAFEVHKNLGPGLLEKVYEVCFAHELQKRGLNVKRQIDIPIQYDGIVFQEGLRLDVLVEDLVICELKAVEQVNPVWVAQILSHLKLTGKRLGYLINFDVALIKDGIRRIIL
jgi:GxxExxY protein